MAYETLRYEVADRVATIALEPPDNRNALSDQLLDELIAAFAAARDDDDVALRRAHLDRTSSVFSSGANLGGFAADAPVVDKHLGTERFPTPVPRHRRARQADDVRGQRARARRGARASRSPAT